MATYYTDVATIVDLKLRDLNVAADGDVTADQLENACKQAHDIINSKLGRVCSPVPFDTADPPAIIRELSDMLVVNIVWRYGPGRSVRAKGTIQDEYDRAIAMLDDIASGKDRPPGVTRKTAADGLSSSTEDEHPVFGSVGTMDLGQDPDQAERLTDERS